MANNLKNYKDGNILSLTVTNFQTFKKQKFTFGPALNLIAAPNGSGKSSIANSIAFLFNGTPKTIGKSKLITEFIRFESKEAEIEGEIFYKNKVYNLKRKITQHGSSFFIDGSLVSKGEYFKFLAELNIDVNNLCTFLPQERVSEFCRMTSAELLTEFLKSTDVDLTRVKQLYDDMTVINNKLESTEKKREVAEQNYNILKNNLDAIKEREANEEKLKKLLFLKYHTQYKALKDEYQNYKQEILLVKNRRDELVSKEIEIKEEIKVIEDKKEFKEYKAGCQILSTQNKKISELSNLIKEKNHNLDILDLDLKNKYKKAEEKKNEVEKKKVELLDFKNKLKTLKSEKDLEINNYIKKVDNIFLNPDYSESLSKNDVNIPSNVTRVDQIEGIVPSTKIIEDKIRNFEYQISQMKIDSEKIQREIESLEQQKINHSEMGNQRLEMLKNYHLDTYKGVMWLRKNQIFKDEILEPLYVHINIDKEYAEYVETFLSFQVLSTFIVKNDEDFSKITTILKDELNLKVNVATMSSAIPPRIKNEDLKYFNLDGVLSDFIECRQEYKNYLDSQGWFNNIPVSRNEIYYIQNGKKIPASEEDIYNKFPNVRKSAINGRYSEIKRSRYGNDYVINTSSIHARETFTFPKIDIELINTQLSNLNKQRELNKLKMEKILEERIDLQKKRDFIKTEFDISKISKIIYHYNSTLNNIAHLETLISQFDISSIEGLISEIKEKKLLCKKENLKIILELEKLLGIENIPSFDFEKFKNLKFDLENLNKNLTLNNIQMEDDLVNLKNLEKIKEENKEKMEDLKLKLRSHTKYDIEHLKGFPENIFEIDAEISRLKTVLQLCAKNNSFLNDFKEKEKMVNELLDNVDLIKNRKISIEEKYEREKAKVSDEIHAFLSPVNTKFEELFRKLNYEGHVALDTNGKDWELKVLVKFREVEDLQKLTAFRQSGGEKSLTTILFLLALQQSQSAPFRLVDEINQGMDSVNESKVFEILKEMGDSSQFFIITPKMIEGLAFSENTNAIIVYGGPGVTKDLENYTLSVLN